MTEAEKILRTSAMGGLLGGNLGLRFGGPIGGAIGCVGGAAVGLVLGLVIKDGEEGGRIMAQEVEELRRGPRRRAS